MTNLIGTSKILGLIELSSDYFYDFYFRNFDLEVSSIEIDDSLSKNVVNKLYNGIKIKLTIKK